MTSTRQIAVIMFTDIVGYTVMMGENEKEALSILRKNKEIHNKWLKQFNGKWLKEMGDGILASFQTISDAVYCAGSILREIKDIPKLNLRIGIHLGEVEVDGNELYGDGVNIASRIEGIAESGQLLVSETIYNNIRNKEGIQTTFLGEHDLKNVGHPVKIYSLEVTDTPEMAQEPLVGEKKGQKSKWMLGAVSILALLAIVYFVVIPFLKEGISSSAESFPGQMIEKSVAVLPFNDMSPNKDQEYLGDGIAEEILNVLAQRKELKVIGRTSSFSYKGKETDLKTIGAELGVATILEGSVRKDGNQIRITAQFINTEDGSHLWSASFDRELKDIFRLQDEIADSVSRSLLVSLNISDQEETRENIIDNEAYNLYLQGRFHRTKADDIGEDRKKNLYKAIDYFNQAIAIDSGFVEAYAELAATYGNFGFFYGDREINNVWQLTETYAIKTLGLDKANVQALRTMGAIKRNRYWDWDSARDYYQKALSSAPNNARAMREYSLLLSAINQQDSAMYYAKKALALNPTSDDFKTGAMRAAYYSRNYPEAIHQSEKIETLTGESYFFLMLVFVQANKEKAVEMILENMENIDTKTALEKTFRVNGWKSFLQEIVQSEANLETVNLENQIFLEVTPTDEIFKQLNRDAGDKVGNLVYLLADPIYDPLRSDPRFDELLDMMGLDKYK